MGWRKYLCCCSYKKKKTRPSPMEKPPTSNPSAPPLLEKTKKTTQLQPKMIQNNDSEITNSDSHQQLDTESWIASTWFHHTCFFTGCITLLITLARCISLITPITNYCSCSLWLQLIFADLTSYLLADLASGIYHWAVDNYGSPQTPVFGAQIEIFLVHHMHPLAITKRHVSRLLHVPSVIVTAFMMFINLVSSDPILLWFAVSFSGLVLFSQLFHAWAHTPKGKLPALVVALQDVGVLVGRGEHARHHRVPFDSNYCIVSGVWNRFLDRSCFFFGMELLVFKVFGIKPRSWSDDELN